VNVEGMEMPGAEVAVDRVGKMRVLHPYLPGCRFAKI
jgi:hypothetical protein